MGVGTVRRKADWLVAAGGKRSPAAPLADGANGIVYSGG